MSCMPSKGLSLQGGACLSLESSSSPSFPSSSFTGGGSSYRGGHDTGNDQYQVSPYRRQRGQQPQSQGAGTREESKLEEGQANMAGKQGLLQALQRTVGGCDEGTMFWPGVVWPPPYRVRRRQCRRHPHPSYLGSSYICYYLLSVVHCGELRSQGPPAFLLFLLLVLREEVLEPRARSHSLGLIEHPQAAIRPCSPPPRGPSSLSSRRTSL